MHLQYVVPYIFKMLLHIGLSFNHIFIFNIFCRNVSQVLDNLVHMIQEEDSVRETF